MIKTRKEKRGELPLLPSSGGVSIHHQVLSKFRNPIKTNSKWNSKLPNKKGVFSYIWYLPSINTQSPISTEISETKIYFSSHRIPDEVWEVLHRGVLPFRTLLSCFCLFCLSLPFQQLLADKKGSKRIKSVAAQNWGEELLYTVPAMSFLPALWISSQHLPRRIYILMGIYHRGSTFVVSF